MIIRMGTTQARDNITRYSDPYFTSTMMHGLIRAKHYQPKVRGLGLNWDVSLRLWVQLPSKVAQWTVQHTRSAAEIRGITPPSCSKSCWSGSQSPLSPVQDAAQRRMPRSQRRRPFSKHPVTTTGQTCSPISQKHSLSAPLDKLETDCLYQTIGFILHLLPTPARNVKS